MTSFHHSHPFSPICTNFIIPSHFHYFDPISPFSPILPFSPISPFVTCQKSTILKWFFVKNYILFEVRNILTPLPHLDHSDIFSPFCPNFTILSHFNHYVPISPFCPNFTHFVPISPFWPNFTIFKILVIYAFKWKFWSKTTYYPYMQGITSENLV